MSVLFPAFDFPHTAIMGLAGRRNCSSRAALVRKTAFLTCIIHPRYSVSEHLINIVDADEIEVLTDIFGDLLHVLFILLGDNDIVNTDTVCGKRLLLEAADGKHLPAQRDLACHGDVAADGLTRECGKDRRSHRDACRRSVLGRCALGDMDMDILVLKRIIGNAVFFCVRTDIADGGARGFLHHVAQFSCQQNVALALASRRPRW